MNIVDEVNAIYGDLVSIQDQSTQVLIIGSRHMRNFIDDVDITFIIQ